MHRWLTVRAHMGPQFVALLNWITYQRRALEGEVENRRAWAGTQASIDALSDSEAT